MSGLTLNAYQDMSGYTAIYPEVGTGSAQALSYVTLGLVGEAGEIANKVKKIIRDQQGVVSDEARTELAKELGDVLWYVAGLARELGADLGAVADDNIEKLLDRHERGVLTGSGDNR